jgi:hypothetical protein
MLTMEFPKVYFGKDGWKLTGVVDGRLFERHMTEYAVMGLLESIAAAQKQRARPKEMDEWDRRVAC